MTSTTNSKKKTAEDIATRDSVLDIVQHLLVESERLAKLAYPNDEIKANGTAKGTMVGLMTHMILQHPTLIVPTLQMISSVESQIQRLESGEETDLEVMMAKDIKAAEDRKNSLASKVVASNTTKH